MPRLIEKKVTHRNDMQDSELAVHLLDVIHGNMDPGRLLRKMGVSRRNWRILLRRMGLDDGTVWTLGELAQAEKVSRPRIVQIVQRTLELFRRHYGLSQTHMR